MSLESKIEKLTLAIESLTIAMSSGSIAQAITTVTEVKEIVETVGNASVKTTEKKTTEKKPTKKTKPVEKVEPQEPDLTDEKIVSADDLKAACLKAARSAPEAKAKVKALLKEFGATIVKDVVPHDRATVLARLESNQY